MARSDHSDSGPAIYACVAIEDVPVPYVASERGRYCNGCGREVWFDPRCMATAEHVATAEANGQVVINCERCLADTIAIAQEHRDA